MKKAMIQCNGVQTQVIAEGRWIEETAPEGSKDIVLVIPGNPGVPEFYEGFLKAIRSRISEDIPIWIVGHAGHVQPPGELLLAMPRDSEGKHYYDMTGQLQHKTEFIKKYIPANAKVHLIGHSIGAWFSINLLKDSIVRDKIAKCYLLFPTIEHMAKSPNGRFLTSIARRIFNCLLYLAWLFSFLPISLQYYCVRLYGIFFGIPAKSINAVLTLINPNVLTRVFRLAKEEMTRVKDMDHDLISQNANKIWMYYGTTDGWTPVSYYENMKKDHPNVEAELCKKGISHSFVLKHEEEMGHIVADVINRNITTA
ncbi:lipid droplet-associated hydrolase [Prorops nasuta]|uniref:lipid droplet-associated hydrolase n=1 Tax=Prorops nasuta TaxID=863751 RepID=UPI0034CD8C6C